MEKKPRTPISKDISAEVLFESDRTCCICRGRGKPVQIHHIDENPVNNEKDNLAVLCLECHDKTQIRGGFGRKLDSGQIKLYRDNWHLTVNEQRATTTQSDKKESESRGDKKVEDNSIQVEVVFGSTGYETGSPYGLYILTIKNFGNKPIFLSSAYIELPNGSRIFYPPHYEQRRFPYKLESYDSYSVEWPIQFVLDQVEKCGFKGLKETKAFFIDKLGGLFYSKPFPLE